jgi:membrane-associated phospholipid phosphatase
MVRFLTDFADQAVAIPLILAVALVLAVQGWRRGALLWLTIAGTTFAATLAAKLIFLGCAPVFGSLNIHSPSGHTAAATVVAGGLAALFARSRAVVLPVALVAGTIIGASRVGLNLHSLPEVLTGGAIGLCGAIAMRRYVCPPGRLAIAPALGTIAAITLVLHGTHLPAETAIRQSASWLAWLVAACRPL